MSAAVQSMSFKEFVEQHPSGKLWVDELHNPDDFSETVDIFETVLDVSVVSEGKTYRIETESGRVMMVGENATVRVQLDD